jgi:hypothetical protein
MVCIIIIAFIILYAVSLIWNNVTDDKDARLVSALLLTISAISVVTLFIMYGDRNTPTAKSVYEGKTTLEITYRDSIPIDTIVVLKPEFIKK